MIDLVFVTNNKFKLEEIQNIVGFKYRIMSLKDINCYDEIPETHMTIEENASEKSHYIYKRYELDCFADDTGLEIDALDGRPGVFSARYAGEGKDFDDNMNKVLSELQNISNRKARFRTVISLILDGNEYQFEGIVNGQILTQKIGKKGFGYDPIFQPDGFSKSFAQLTMKEKNKISHRGMA
ncbi:MAG TPA: non-canonical purine NTP diphosphatase, partial [Bacteroidales bacterium]|nr:non-canonical purine NTP diphosphatase [Bacteroidales bacterium]